METAIITFDLLGSNRHSIPFWLLVSNPTKNIEMCSVNQYSETAEMVILSSCKIAPKRQAACRHPDEVSRISNEPPLAIQASLPSEM